MLNIFPNAEKSTNIAKDFENFAKSGDTEPEHY